MIINSGTTIVHDTAESGTTVQESHTFSGTVVTQFEGGAPVGITVDSTLYRADSTLITADNG